jgi:hypothetical protein
MANKVSFTIGTFFVLYLFQYSCSFIPVQSAFRGNCNHVIICRRDAAIVRSGVITIHSITRQ